MSYRWNWQHFTPQDFAALQRRLRDAWREILPGGEYFGQIRTRDVCWDIQTEWLRGEEEPYVTLSPFFPHDAASPEPPYQEMVPGMPFDTYDEASLVISRRAFLRWPYLQFCDFVTRHLSEELKAPVFAAALAENTGFWDRHDARLRALREAAAAEKRDDPGGKM